VFTRLNLSTVSVDKFGGKLAKQGIFHCFMGASLICLIFRRFCKMLIFNEKLMKIRQIIENITFLERVINELVRSAQLSKVSTNFYIRGSCF
jgi:hypothetical protein